MNGQTGEPLVGANKKITKTMLRHVAESYDTIEIDPSPIRNKIFDIIQTFEQKFSDADMERERNLDKIESSEDTADSGVVKQVRVFLASKGKLYVGENMAGRNGNKGIVANIGP